MKRAISDLTSQQWSTLAVEDEELVKAIQEETERQRREKQAETLKETLAKGESGVSDNLLSETKTDEHENTVATKLARQFKTNRTYVNKARKLKVTAPEKFEAVIEGRTTYEQIEKQVANANNQYTEVPSDNKLSEGRIDEESKRTAVKLAKQLRGRHADARTGAIIPNFTLEFDLL